MGPRATRVGLGIVLAVGWGVATAPPAVAQGQPARLEALSRQIVDARLAQEGVELYQASVESAGARRFKNGLRSLLVPGWSQYHAGHYTRAAIFFGAEVAVWSSFTVFRLQGSKRRQSFEEYATTFAGVQSTDHNDAYWLRLSEYLSSEDYNMAVRRDQRSGTGEIGPLVSATDSWRWISQERFVEFNRLRIGSEDAYSRASFVTLFAVINRLVSFLDGARSGSGDDDPFAESPGVSLRFDGAPFGRDPAASLGLRSSF